MGSLRKFRRQGKVTMRPGRSRSGPKPGSIRNRALYQFFESVLGAPISSSEVDRLRPKLTPLYTEFKNPKTSLTRLREVWDEFASVGTKFVQRDILAEEINRISWHAGIGPTDRVASLGSGIALLEAYLAKKLLPNGKIICIDLSPEMNKIAEQTKAKTQARNMSILTRSGTETSLQSNSQDKVFALRTYLENTVHWQPLLQEAKRIIRKTPDARLVITFESKKPDYVNDIKQSLKRNGFQPVQVFDYAVMPIVNTKSVMIIAKPVLS